MPLTFKNLAKTYDDFSVPQYEINLGSSKYGLINELKVKEYPVLSINVHQSIGSATTAQIAFACPFLAEEGEFKNKIYDKLKAAEMIEIKLGYTSSAKMLKTVFIGLIGTVNTGFAPGGVTVSITCYDVKMLLFHNVHWRSFGEKKKIQEVVSEILNPYDNYCNVTIARNNYDSSVNTETGHEWKQDNIDDYSFIMRLAAFSNSSFYAREDTLYFVENIADTAKAAVKLGWGEGLMAFSADIDISRQIGSVEVRYKDDKGKPMLLEPPYTGSDIKGDGELARAVSQAVANKKREVVHNLAKDSVQAKLLAKYIFLQSAMTYVSGRGSTIGIPDIQAGDAIEITGVGKKLEGTYLLTQVSHQYSAGGYLTNFICQRAKI